MRILRQLGFEIAVFGLLAAVFVSSAFAQAPTITTPYGTLTTNNSSTITTGVGGAFQQIWAQSTASRGRVGCTVQNNGSNPMYVYFGAIADATVAKAVKLAVGQAVSCTIGGIVLKDQVSISGTVGEAFYAALQ